MTDMNTVSLSGVLNGDVETAESKGIKIARFFIDVEGAGDQRPCGIFKVVAFADWAEAARNLSSGDQVVLVGALCERRAKGRREVEIRIRNLIRLPKEMPEEEPADFKVTEVEQGNPEEQVEE